MNDVIADISTEELTELVGDVFSLGLYHMVRGPEFSPEASYEECWFRGYARQSVSIPSDFKVRFQFTGRQRVRKGKRVGLWEATHYLVWGPDNERCYVQQALGEECWLGPEDSLTLTGRILAMV